MDDKINLDELRRMISGYETQGSDIDIGDITTSDTSTPAQESVESESIQKDESKEIVVDVIKPEGVSITGAFEAIKTERTVQKPSRSDDEESEEITEEQPEPATDSEPKKSVEITAEIDHKRYFSTEEFESIKNKSGSDFKGSIASFTKGVEEEDDGEEECYHTAEFTEEIDDFENPEEREDILLDLKKMNASASFKSMLTFILMLFSGVFFVAVQLGFSIPGLAITHGSRLVLTIILSLSVVATIVNFNTLVNGFAALLKFKCTPETMLLFSFVFNTVLDLMYLIGNKHFDGNLISFDFIYMLLLTFNIFSKKLLAKNIYKNFLIASSEGQKMVIDRPENEAIANDIILETGNGGDIIYATKSKFVSDFVHNSFKDFDNCSKGSIFYTFCAFVIIVISFVTLALSKDVVHMMAYAAGAFSVVNPILLTYSFAVSIFINSSKARRFGGVIVGSESGYAIEDAQTLIADDSDIFNVALNGIRLYGDTEIDECILYLNTLFGTVGGPLRSLFSDMLTESITTLPRADEIYYHDTMGYSCLIHSKLFVVGNKALMDHFNVEVDDSEFEIIYQQKSKNVLFAAYDGKLMGVFLLTYALSHGVQRAFDVFENDQMSVCIAERDANITEALLHNSFKSTNKSLFTIMKFRTARNLLAKFEPRNKAPSILLSNTGLKGIASAIHGCRSMLFAIKTNNVIKIISSVMAIILITFLLLFSQPSANLPVHILIFQALWSLPILFVSLFSK